LILNSLSSRFFPNSLHVDEDEVEVEVELVVDKSNGAVLVAAVLEDAVTCTGSKAEPVSQ
jgi:nitrogen regulatory protein PII-like uncharacterized protein